MSKAETILERLEMVRKTGSSKWIARCPAHDDGTPSLSVTEIEGGNRVLIHCHGGCGALDVLESIGLDWSALYQTTKTDTAHCIGLIKTKKPLTT